MYISYAAIIGMQRRINNKLYISVGISFPQELLREIDLDRGDIPRSKYVNKVLLGIIRSSHSNRNHNKLDSLDATKDLKSSSEPTNLRGRCFDE